MITRIGHGIELISNRKPESRSVGRKAESSATWLATNWFLVAAEISRPCPSAGIRKADEIADQRQGRAAKRHAEHVTASTVQSAIEQRPSRKYGMTLVAMNSPMPSGVAIAPPSVPRSHSRATTSAVSSVPIMVITTAIEPGTRRKRLVSSGLNQ